jgi:hypothetical protein
MTKIKRSRAFKRMSYMNKMILIEYRNGKVYAYPAQPWDWAIMQKPGVSAGRYLNKVLKPRGSVKVSLELEGV